MGTIFKSRPSWVSPKVPSGSLWQTSIAHCTILVLGKSSTFKGQCSKPQTTKPHLLQVLVQYSPIHIEWIHVHCLWICLLGKSTQKGNISARFSQIKLPSNQPGLKHLLKEVKRKLPVLRLLAGTDACLVRIYRTPGLLPPNINTSRDFSPIFPTNTGSEGLVVEDSQKGWLKETLTCFFDGGQFTLFLKQNSWSMNVQPLKRPQMRSYADSFYMFLQWCCVL